jgi:hypothetical protein
VAETPETPASSIPPAQQAEPAQGGGGNPGSPPTRRRVDRRILAALAALVVIVALLALTLPQFLGSSSGETVWQKITAGITDGVVPKQTALEAFAYVFKTDIPGVSVPSGVNGSDVPTSSSGVMRWVKANWSALTPAQQAVINGYTEPQPGPHFTPGETLSNPSNGVQLAAYRPPTSGATQPDRLAFPIDTTVAPDAPPDLALAMAFDVEADIAHIGPRLGMDVLSNGGPLFPNVTLTLSDKDGGNGLFLTQAIVDGFGNYMPCHITAWKNLWTTQTANGDSVSPVLHDLITHEVIHCYQNVVWGSVDTALAIPPWITEGTAIYLSADDTQVAEPMMQSMWKNGYFMADRALTNRSYDAYGYYSLLAHAGRDMWSLMLPAWKAAAAGPQRSDPFIAVLKGDDPDIRNVWAESLVDNSAWGDPWQLYGLFAPHPANVFQHPVQAQLGDGWSGTLPGRSNILLNVNAASGEVVVINTDGLASVRDDSGNTKLDFGSGTFCVSDKGCVCPNDSVLAGQNMASDKLTIPFTAAMNAPEGGSHYNITAYKLDDLCQKKATPRPSFQQQPPSNPNNPCGTSCSNSNGDPHMITINHYRYDFQAAGEFTLLRSTDGSLEIQARQEPWDDSKAVAINTAVAAKVGDHTVGVYVTDSGLQAHVDGQVADFSSGPIDLGNGGSISAIDKGFEVDFPDGTQMWALSVGQWGINAEIKPSAAISTTGMGLLGEVVPGGLGVPTLPDGTRLPAATDRQARFQTIYGQFADAWRITDATSLFDYDSGKTTESYTIKPFPQQSKVQSVSDLSADQLTAGNSACSGITDQDLHDQCVFDVGVTGQAGFAQSYDTVQSFIDNGIAPAATSTPTPAPATPPPGTVSAGWKVPGVMNVANFTWGDNDTVYVSVQTGDQAYSVMHLDPVNQQVVAQVSVPAPTEVHYAAGSVWLPGLKTDANGNTCSVTRLDGQTLAEQATIPVPCGYFGKPEMASDGTNIWFVDVSKYDLGTGQGAAMTELDPTTNAPSSTSVPLPFINGYRIDSQGAFFYFDTDPTNGYYRLTTGAGAFESLGGLNSPAHPAGTGVWVQAPGGTQAQYYASSGSPQATLEIGGSLVAGDQNAAYAEVLGNSPQDTAEEQLWRYPVDGSTPAQIASTPTLDGQFLSYFDDPQPIANGDGVLKFWNIGSNLGGPFLLIQWVPVK